MTEINTARPLILIVDDMPANIQVLAEALRAEYQIKVTTSGLAALDIIQKNKPVLVLLDVMMPGLDGYEICRRIKENPETKDILVIFVTAKSDAVDEEEGLNLGAVDYITKPFHLPIIKSRVRNHVNLKLKSDMLENIAFIDGLTSIPNRRRFDEALEMEWKRALRTGTPISLVLMDIDYFKRYNDHYGHGMGDICLQQAAAALAAAATRPSDLVARYGGEEFVALLPHTDAAGAILIAERLRHNVEALKLAHGYSDAAACVTISSGVASRIPMAEDSPADLLKQADQMLYRAKKAGRNQVCFRDEQP